MDLISMTEARRLVSRTTIEDAVRSGRVPVYTSGLDRRRRMVRADDIRELGEIRQIDRPARRENETVTSLTAA